MTEEQIAELVRMEVTKQMHSMRTEMIGVVPRDFPSVTSIIEAVSREWCVFVVDILSHGRCRRMTRPRQVAMYLAVKLTAHTFKELGRAFDRDPTTVIHGHRLIGDLMRRDDVLCRRVNTLMDRLEAPRKVA